MQSTFLCIHLFSSDPTYTCTCIHVCSLALDEGAISALGLDGMELAWVDTMLRFRLLTVNSAGTLMDMYYPVDILHVACTCVMHT